MKAAVKIVLLLVAIAAVGGLVAHEAGYIPVKALLNIEEPKNSVTYIESDYANIVIEIIENIPELDGIKYSIFGTEESIRDVMTDYNRTLVSYGYSVYNNTQGDGKVFNYNYSYVVYLKGITAVGIMAFSVNDTTYVVYATGNGFNLDAIYKELMG